MLFDLAFFLFRLGFLKSEVQFAELFIEILLSAGEFVEPIHHLPHLALSRVVGGFRATFGLVAILVVLQFQLLNLLLSRTLTLRLRLARRLRLLGLVDLELPCAEFQEALIGGTLLLHRLSE